MKKNLMSVLILALLIVNLVMTAMLTFSVMPAASNANKLIEQVANAIHLELNTGKTTGQNNVPLDDIVLYEVNEGEQLVISLTHGSDNVDHMCVLKVYLSLNSKHEDYSKWSPEKIKSHDSTIKNCIINVISKYTKDEINDPDFQYEASQKILDDLIALFDSDVIVSVGFSYLICQ